MAEVPPFLWSDAGTFASPKTYTVPGAGEVQPYTATATYVNASGQAILPALRIKSAEGALLALTFPVGQTIADSSSSEVTFVPPFGSAPPSPAPSGGGRMEVLKLVTSGATIPAYLNNNAQTAVRFFTINEFASIGSYETSAGPWTLSGAATYIDTITFMEEGLYQLVGSLDLGGTTSTNETILTLVANFTSPQGWGGQSSDAVVGNVDTYTSAIFLVGVSAADAAAGNVSAQMQALHTTGGTLRPNAASLIVTQLTTTFP